METYFLGSFKHSIDIKNRLTLPAKFAIKFTKNKAVITKGFEGCLEVWNSCDFDKRVNQILSYSQNKKNSRILSRQIFANSNEVEIDKAKRILLPTNLKDMASIKKDVMIIGVGNKIEIWNIDAYEKFCHATNKEFEEVAEKIDNENDK